MENISVITIFRTRKQKKNFNFTIDLRHIYVKWIYITGNKEKKIGIVIKVFKHWSFRLVLLTQMRLLLVKR